jgi:uncharacterized protein with beta-barrel porin domain
MFDWRNGVSSSILVGLATLSASTTLSAQTFTVTTGATDTAPKTLNGTQTGTVDAGATLRSTTGTATITWNGASTGVVIMNSGVIENTSTGRVIDASGAVANRTLTFLNNVGAVTRSAQNDVLRFNLAITSGTILIDNAGLIQAGGTGFAGLGQALDFRGMSASGPGLTITNRATGVIEALTDDAIRPGRNAIINNAGIIRSFGANTSGGANGTADGIDAGAITGVVVNNQNGGLISGARHGVTADADITVNNASGGVILGRNGSGVGSDGAGTVINYGTITGTYAGAGNIFNSNGVAQVNGDGDGVDIDTAATIVNYGLIEGTGAGGFDSGGRANNGEGISIGGGSISNYGTISGASFGIVVNNDSVASRSGVAATTITNNAGASIIGQNGYAIRLENKTGTAADNDAIVNRGKIIGNGAIPDPNAVVLMQSGAVDTNSVGTLNGVAYTGTGSARFIRGDGSAIQMGEGADLFTNYGTVIGNTGRAVNLEGGADTANIMSGSRITGLVDGGAGTDTLNYNKVGLTEAKRAALQAGQTVNIGGTLYTSFEVVNGAALPFSSFANSASAQGVAGLFDNGSTAVAASSNVVALMDAVAGAPDIGAALAQLSPAAYQGVGRMTMDSAFQTASQVGQRLTQGRFGGPGVDLGAAGAALAMFDQGLFDRHGMAPDRALSAITRYSANETGALNEINWLNGQKDAYEALAYAPTKAPSGSPVVIPDTERGLFVSSGLNRSREGARPDAPAIRSSTASVVAGADWRLSDRAFAGVFGGFARTRGDLDAIGSTTTITTRTAGFYGSYQASSWFANAIAMYGWSDYENTRVALGNANGSAFNGTHYALRGATGIDLRFSGWLITPELALQYTRVNTDGFAETGGVTALNVAADHSESLRSSLGVRFAREFRVQGGVLTPEARLAWLHEFRDGVRGISASFADVTLPGVFLTPTGSAIRDRGAIGAGLSGKLGPLTTVSVGYDAIVGDDAVAHQLTGRLRHSF